MAEDQRRARIFGVLFIITYVTSISALALFQPVLDDPAGYIAGGGKDNQVYLGAFLEFLLIIANVGTAVVVFPILRRQNELLALGYVTARVIECVFLGAGIIFVLTVAYGVPLPEATAIALLDRVISVFSIIVFGSIAYAISGKPRGEGRVVEDPLVRGAA